MRDEAMGETNQVRLSRRTVLAGGASLAAGALLAACSRTNDRASTDTSTSTSRPTGSTGSTGSTASTPTGTSAPSGSSGTTPTSPAGGAYVPPAAGEWQTVDAAAAGWSVAKLDELAAMVEQSNSRTFMMLSGGRILREHYWAGATADTVQDIASAQKSVLSTLYGIAVAKGILQLDDHVSTYLPAGWSNAHPEEEAAITIEHLLTMSSGLSPKTLKRTSDPGTVWEYNTDAYQKLRPVLEAAAKSDIQTVSRSWMFDTIGVSAAETWRARPGADTDATGAPAWGLLLTARDMARFGLLAQRLGAWAGTTVVSESWLRAAWTPTAVKRDYGYLWWLMGKGGLGAKGAPADWVAALGAQDQKIYVIPSLDLVVTRQGLAAKEVADAASDFDARLIKAILAARA